MSIKNVRGFTLIELLVVLFILGLLGKTSQSLFSYKSDLRHIVVKKNERTAEKRRVEFEVLDKQCIDYMQILLEESTKEKFAFSLSCDNLTNSLILEVDAKATFSVPSARKLRKKQAKLAGQSDLPVGDKTRDLNNGDSASYKMIERGQGGQSAKYEVTDRQCNKAAVEVLQTVIRPKPPKFFQIMCSSDGGLLSVDVHEHDELKIETTPDSRVSKSEGGSIGVPSLATPRD